VSERGEGAVSVFIMVDAATLNVQLSTSKEDVALGKRGCLVFASAKGGRMRKGNRRNYVGGEKGGYGTRGDRIGCVVDIMRGDSTGRNMAIPLKGVIHGKTIELEQALNFPDGQEVTVVVQPSESGAKLPAGEGLRRAFGGWSDDIEGLDKYLEWNRQQRKRTRRESAE
jgi:hypothetical protein